MQLLEGSLLILLIILSIQWFLPSVMKGIEKRLLMGLLTIITVILTLIVGILYGFRWQLLPIYLPVLIFLIYELFQQRNMLKSNVEASAAQVGAPRKKLGAGILIVMLALMTTTVTLDSMLPMFVLPEPTGQYNVGTTDFELTDTS
ncbi:MAG: hypothetical protein ACXAEF_03555, partial [Candidatus Thorarchaeota archaeon]